MFRFSVRMEGQLYVVRPDAKRWFCGHGLFSFRGCRCELIAVVTAPTQAINEACPIAATPRDGVHATTVTTANYK